MKGRLSKEFVRSKKVGPNLFFLYCIPEGREGKEVVGDLRQLFCFSPSCTSSTLFPFITAVLDSHFQTAVMNPAKRYKSGTNKACTGIFLVEA
jgi:hypothetical protein